MNLLLTAVFDPFFCDVQYLAHVLPYFRFVYAEGDDARIEIAFASHLVTVTGHGLTALLAAVSTQRVVRVIQPTTNGFLRALCGISQRSPRFRIVVSSSSFTRSHTNRLGQVQTPMAELVL